MIVAFLALPDSDYITGQLLAVDGGYLARGCRVDTAATDAASGGSRMMPNESTTRTAVVVGSTGIIGRAIAAKLAEVGGWRVIGVTRSGATVPGVDAAIAVDLLDPDEARRRLAPAAGAMHLFFAAYLSQGSWAAEVVPTALLANAVEGLEAIAHPFGTSL